MGARNAEMQRLLGEAGKLASPADPTDDTTGLKYQIDKSLPELKKASATLHKLAILFRAQDNALGGDVSSRLFAAVDILDAVEATFKHHGSK